MRLRGSFKGIGIAITILIISIVILLVANNGIAQPFQMNYELDSPSGVFQGENHWKYVIDGAKKMILAIDEKNHLDYIIKGNKENKGFYYASLICADSNNNIYVADTLYADKGTIIEAERILKYNSRGQFLGMIHEIKYDDESLAPLQYGNILSLDFNNGFLIYSYKTQKGLEIFRIDADMALNINQIQNMNPNLETISESYNEKVNEYVFENFMITSADVDVETLLPVFITRKGGVYKVEDQATIIELSRGSKAEIAWKIDLDLGEVYYTNLASKEIIKITKDGLKERVYQDGSSILFQISVLDGVVLATDYGGIYIIDDGEAENITTLNSGKLVINVIIFICLTILFLVGTYLLLNVGFLFKGIWPNKSFQKALIIVSVSFFISTLVVYLALSSMFQLVDKNIMKDISVFCELMVQETDIESLAEIDDISDYRGEYYNKIKDDLDQMIKASYTNGTYYYYIVYKLDQSKINGVMDYEDTMTSYHPFYEWDEEEDKGNERYDDEYTDVLKNKESKEFLNDISSYGTWSYVLKPIVDDSGEAIGIMEVGVNTDEIIKVQNNLIKDIIITIVCSVIIMIIIMLEVVFYMHYRERKRKSYDADAFGYRFPVRSLIFISFLADSMQDAFIPILVSKMHEPILNIPKHIIIAFPITMQLFATAIFSFIGGGIVTRIGVKKTLIQGFIIQMIGYIIIAITTGYEDVLLGSISGYIGILVGKTIVGIGMGLIIVVVNTIAAVSGKEGAVLFGEINSGILAGVTAGVGIGAVILSIQDYSAVYSVAAAIVFCGFVLAIFGEEYHPYVDKVVKTSANIITFIFSKEIITFLLLILTPFLIALSYREYFFPLYAQTMGMTESTIGYIYLISGLIVIYLGPSLTRNLIKKLGERKTVIASSMLMCMAAFVFVMFSTISAAVVGIFILSIAISFGYAAQSTYYSSRPIVASYGEGRAMGVYALFDNGGQTLGPVLYGSALAFGFQTGVFVIGAVVSILMIVFILSNLRRWEKNV